MIDIIDIDLTYHINWHHSIDNSIRKIGEEGYLTVSCGQGENVNMLSVKHFLGRRFGLEASIVEEKPLWAKKIINQEKWTKEDYITTTTFKIKRKNYSIYKDKKWTFSILTKGDRVDDVIKFCESIRKLDKNFKHQILIHGPKNKKYDKYKVDYIKKVRDYREEYVEICAKKNDIVDQAKNQNLLICHDRYYLSENFFKGFEKYGYDFDFVTVDTRYEDGGGWFPHYVKMEYFKHDFKWNKERYVFKDKDFAEKNEIYPVFINGGLNIFKRDVIKEIRYNECFFWHQVEDVELSKEFMKRGLIPRANMYSTVITTKAPHDVIGINLEMYNDVVGGEVRTRKKHKKNLYKRLRKSLFKKVYNVITNKKFLNFLEKKIFKLD